MLSESSQPQGQEANDTKSEIEEALGKARNEWLAEDLVSLGVCVELNTKTEDYCMSWNQMQRIHGSFIPFS